MAALLGAAAIGYGNAKGWLSKIPTIGGSRPLTLAIAGYALSRLTSNPTARSLGRTAMSIGAYDFGVIQGGGKTSLNGEGVEGDDIEADGYDDVSFDE